MDKGLKNFIAMACMALFFFALIFLAFFLLYRYSTIDTYNYILLILINLTIILTAAFLLSAASVFYAYRRGKAGGGALIFAKLGLRILLVFTAVMPDMLKTGRESVMGFYIHMNNILVESQKPKYRPGDVLVLLPHCLQNTGCNFKITNSMDNCKRCGKCCIGSIAAMVEKMGVKAVVVTGGTAARNLVAAFKPKLILSVACERDLVSGIADVRGIPVIGILNERPNGPCCNTRVDVEVLRRKLECYTLP